MDWQTLQILVGSNGSLKTGSPSLKYGGSVQSWFRCVNSDFMLISRIACCIGDRSRSDSILDGPTVMIDERAEEHEMETAAEIPLLLALRLMAATSI